MSPISADASLRRRIGFLHASKVSGMVKWTSWPSSSSSGRSRSAIVPTATAINRAVGFEERLPDRIGQRGVEPPKRPAKNAASTSRDHCDGIASGRHLRRMPATGCSCTTSEAQGAGAGGDRQAARRAFAVLGIVSPPAACAGGGSRMRTVSSLSLAAWRARSRRSRPGRAASASRLRQARKSSSSASHFISPGALAPGAASSANAFRYSHSAQAISASTNGPPEVQGFRCNAV